MRMDFRQPLSVTLLLPSAKKPMELLLLLCRVTWNLEPSELARALQPGDGLLATAAPAVAVTGKLKDAVSNDAVDACAFTFAAAAAAATAGMLIETASSKRWPAMNGAGVVPTAWCEKQSMDSLRSLSARGNARGDTLHHPVPRAL